MLVISLPMTLNLIGKNPEFPEFRRHHTQFQPMSASQSSAVIQAASRIPTASGNNAGIP
jgi:hypothetical protein